MHFDNVFSTQRTQIPIPDPTILGQNQTIETESNPIEPIVNQPNSSIFMFGFWITAFCIICLVLVKVLPRLDRAILPQSQVPCRNCKFFANENQYLKCAVRPDAVLTKQAINCSDYYDKYGSSFPGDEHFPSKVIGNNQDESKNYQ